MEWWRPILALKPIQADQNKRQQFLIQFVCREPAKNIPEYIRKYYAETGNGRIPDPRVKEVKKSGNMDVYYTIIINSVHLKDQLRTMSLCSLRMQICLTGTPPSM